MTLLTHSYHKIFNTTLEFGLHQLNITTKHWKNQVCNHPFSCYNTRQTKTGWLLMIV